MLTLHPLLGENALFGDIGKIFHPVFLLFGWVLAAIYSVVPNYAVAITGLTILIMAVLTPVTIKSTKSMIAMQRLQPEMKKLQVKYKGPENREALNAEMMKLYKENGTSPFGACLPSLLQMPFLIVLYSLIRGLSYTPKIKGVVTSTPRYLSIHTKIYQDLVHAKGQMNIHFLGMDLSSTPFAHHGTSQALLMIPYLALIAIAIFLQYYQMKQMNSRNPGAAQANPQMQTMQKFFPLIFGFIYLRVPAGATIYMVVSSAMRIGTQEFMFRSGMVTPVTAEREIGGATKGTATKTKELAPPPKPAPKKPKPSSVSDGTGISSSRGTTPPARPAAPSNGAGNGRRQTPAKRPANANGSRDQAEIDAEAAAQASKAHPRSKSKRTRKAR